MPEQVNDPLQAGASMSDKPLAEQELTSVQSEGLGALFSQLGISLVVSTYQAGKIILVRAEGGLLNTHYRNARKPMGIAVSSGQLAVGVGGEITFYSDVPSNCQKLNPPGKHDACFVPRVRHITGDIDIHEMAFGEGGQPWFINTKFSALCTLNGANSFFPVWRPPFVSAYVPEDRCHLNGLCMIAGVPRYVTALGTTDSKAGWRERKADGGVIMDIRTGATVVGGLSMPHSPRWYANQLWFCESGKGLLSTVDPATGATNPIFKFPGFTRGLDFSGPYAFVALSKIRESATFSGIPIAAEDEERNCGIWILDLRSRELVGVLRFTSGVHEIFAVQALRGVRYPELLDFRDRLAMETYFLPAEVVQQAGVATAA